MRHAELFAGIGGFGLAAQWCGWENVFQVEIDKFCQQVLVKNFPDVKKYHDIKEFDGRPYKNKIDIISGGFPCQPFSVAGKRKGKHDSRHLWPQMLRIIREIEPRWVVGENVTGIIGMELRQVLSDLEDSGYSTETFVIPACAINAPHKRNRVWIVANAISKRCDNWSDNRQERYFQDYERITTQNKSERHGWKRGVSAIDSTYTNTNSSRQLQQERIEQNIWERAGNFCEEQITTDPESTRQQGIIDRQEQKQFRGSGSRIIQFKRGWHFTKPGVCGRDDGLSVAMDGFKLSARGHRSERIKSLGNAIVPQVAYQIFKAIDEIKKQNL